jgi:Domain of unknown function (DUF6250)
VPRVPLRRRMGASLRLPPLRVFVPGEPSTAMTFEYQAAAVSAGGPNDRVSDLNCFWMATDRHSHDEKPLAYPSLQSLSPDLEGMR